MTLFTRIYLTLILTLVLTTASVTLVLDQLNRHRFAGFVENRVEAAQALIELNWESVPLERLTDSLEILSRLTGTKWEPTTAEPNLSSRWWREQADVTLALGTDPSYQITARISDWDELLTGTGYLMVNALSLVPSELRNQRLNELIATTGLPAKPVSITAEPLGFLQQRQLEQGQAVIRVDSRPLVQSHQNLYIPMGRGNALKVGPVAQFSWLTPFGLLLLAATILPFIGGVIYLALLPLKRRMARMIQAVDAVAHTPNSVNVPETPADELGIMGRHINNMAARLVHFARRNKELNQAVSHDLKTPLAQLKFAIELLKPTGEQHYMVGKMHQSLTDMEELVNELLIYHSLADKPNAQTKASTDIIELLSNLLSSLTVPSEITLNQDLHTAALVVAGEERLLRRLLGNLIGNALKYGWKQVNVSAHPDDLAQIQIIIEDDGPGIPAAERERVFEPFYRLDRTREASIRGHGLGLAISRDITHLLQGELTISDSDLGGCRVALILPYKG